jgi:hypothetical protein
MNKEEHIDHVLTTRFRPLLLEAAEIIEALKPGEKIPATQLAKMIAERHDMTGPAWYPMLRMMLDGYPGVEVRAGAKGGIIKL